MKEHPYNYDAWFDYVRLEEANGDAEKVRGAMEVKAKPLEKLKRLEGAGSV